MILKNEKFPLNWKFFRENGLSCLVITKHLTVSKIQHFFVTQILREINFGGYRNSKIAVFAILGALNFANLVNCRLQKVQNSKNSKFRACKCVQLAYFALLKMPKLISRKIWVKFPHCDAKIEPFSRINYFESWNPLVEKKLELSFYHVWTFYVWYVDLSYRFYVESILEKL